MLNPDMDNIAQLNRLKCLGAGWEESAQFPKTIRSRKDHHDGNSASSEVLLIGEICVQRHKYFKRCFGKA